MEQWEIIQQQLEDMHADVEKLEEYAELEGSELGEVCTLLCRLSGYSSHMSDELRLVLAAEIKDQLAEFKEHATIVRTQQTYTRETVELEWD